MSTFKIISRAIGGKSSLESKFPKQSIISINSKNGQISPFLVKKIGVKSGHQIIMAAHGKKWYVAFLTGNESKVMGYTITSNVNALNPVYRFSALHFIKSGLLDGIYEIKPESTEHVFKNKIKWYLLHKVE